VIKIVAPKKLKLADAEAELATQIKKQNAKRKQLKDVSHILPLILWVFLHLNFAVGCEKHAHNSIECLAARHSIELCAAIFAVQGHSRSLISMWTSN